MVLMASRSSSGIALAMPQTALHILPSQQRGLRGRPCGSAAGPGHGRLRALPAFLVALLTIALSACGRESADLSAFRAMAGTRLYAIELDGRVRGHMVETRALDGAGQPAIRTVTELELPGNGRSRRSETLTFAATPPHGLLARRLETRTPDGRIHVRSDAHGQPDPQRQWHTAPGPEPQPHGRRPAVAAGSTRLADHLPPAAAGIDAGPELPADDGLVRAADGLPLEYRIGRSFLLRRVDTLPRLPPSAAPEALTVPVAARIGPREAVDSLLLELGEPAAALLEDAPGLEITRASGRLRTHRLAEHIEDQATERLVRSLIATVRARLRYVPGAAPPDLQALLETGEGDCWEFAALFDALARGSGLESRTVTGLAWMGDEARAFGLHAWNELRIDGRWHGVDATFDQLRADGARIRFPDDPAAQLDLQYALADSPLRVLAVNGRAPGALSRRDVPREP